MENTKITKEEFAMRMFLNDLQEGNWEFGTKFNSISQEDQHNYLKYADNLIKTLDGNEYPPYIQEYIDQRDTEVNPYRR